MFICLPDRTNIIMTEIITTLPVVLLKVDEVGVPVWKRTGQFNPRTQ